MQNSWFNHLISLIKWQIWVRNSTKINENQSWTSLTLSFTVVNADMMGFAEAYLSGCYGEGCIDIYLIHFFSIDIFLNIPKVHWNLTHLLGLPQVFCFKGTEFNIITWSFFDTSLWFCSSSLVSRDNFFPKVMCNISTQALIFWLYMYISLNNILRKYISVLILHVSLYNLLFIHFV